MKQCILRFMIAVSALFLLKDTWALQTAEPLSHNITVRFIALKQHSSSTDVNEKSSLSSITVDIPRADLFSNADENNLNEAINTCFGLKPEKVEQAGDNIHAYVSADAVEAVQVIDIISMPFVTFSAKREDFLRSMKLDAEYLARQGVLQVSYGEELLSVLNSPYGRAGTRSMIELNGLSLSSYLMNTMKKAVSTIEESASKQHKQSQSDESDDDGIYRRRTLDENYKQFFYNFADDLDSKLVDIVFNGCNFLDDASQKAHYTYLKQYPQVLQKHLPEKYKNLSAQELKAKKQQLEERIKEFEQDHAGNNDFIAKHKEIMQQLITHLPDCQEHDTSLHHDKRTTDEKPSISAQQLFKQGYAFKMFVKVGTFITCVAAVTWWTAMLWKRINDDEEREDAKTQSHSSALKSKQEITAIAIA